MLQLVDMKETSLFCALFLSLLVAVLAFMAAPSCTAANYPFTYEAGVEINNSTLLCRSVGAEDTSSGLPSEYTQMIKNIEFCIK